MKSTHELAGRLREVILNGTWIANTNYRDQLSNLNWEQANTRVGSLNTIALLAQHIHYYIQGVKQVLKGGTLDIKDKYSFDFPPIHTQDDWERILETLWRDTEDLAALIEQMPDDRLMDVFVEETYGTYQRNFEALIEHSYYH